MTMQKPKVLPADSRIFAPTTTGVPADELSESQSQITLVAISHNDRTRDAVDMQPNEGLNQT